MKIALLGDVAFYGRYSLSGNQDIHKYFKKVSELLKQYDYVIGNLETPFTSNLKPSVIKSACIGSNDENVELLNYLNINIVNLANNHICDYGSDAYIKTKNLLKEQGIKFFGVENKQVLIEKYGTKIALHGYCAYNTNPSGMYRESSAYGVNELNIPMVEKNLMKNHDLGYYNIVSIHSGQEHVNFPSSEDMKMARQLSKVCPYVYYGHHPHVMQGIEEVNESLIAYSLGNFCFDDIYTEKSEKPLVVQSENNKTSFILELEFKENKLVNYNKIPIYMGDVELEINGEEIINKIENYSGKLKENEIEYTKDRDKLINDFIIGRKQLRNFEWYIKRLNYKSIIMILNARKNAKQQFENVTQHLV